MDPMQLKRSGRGSGLLIDQEQVRLQVALKMPGIIPVKE